MLIGGSRDLPDRLQTLRGTIAWSYDLLTEAARRLLGACSVFAGGASLEVIETVCDAAMDRVAQKLPSRHLQSTINHCYSRNRCLFRNGRVRF